jgi:hypothetical protein
MIMDSVNPALAQHVSGLTSFWQSIEHTAEAVGSDVKTVGDAIVHWMSNNGTTLGEVVGAGLVVSGDPAAATLAVQAGSAAQALSGIAVSNQPVSVISATVTMAQHVAAIANAAGNQQLADHANALITAINSAGAEGVVTTSIAAPGVANTTAASVAAS